MAEALVDGSGGQSGDAKPKGRWGGMPKRIRVLIVVAVAVGIALPVLALPTIDRTRDAHFEIVSFDQARWVERDGRYSVSFEQQSRTGFWCSYYEWAVLNVTEQEGLPGGSYTVVFNYPSSAPETFSFTLGANETKTVTGGEQCESSPGQVTITYTLAASPPRLYERDRGIVSGHPRWEMKANLTLRELEGTGGEYLITFRAASIPDPVIDRDAVTASGVTAFNATFQVPDGSCCEISYTANVPKIKERISILTSLGG